MISNQERKERERLQKEADLQRVKLPQMTIEGATFDTDDSETRLICKTPTFTVYWDGLEYKKEEVCELYWRTRDGNYFEFFKSDSGGFVRRIETSFAHELMDIRTPDFQWFLTDIQKKVLKEQDAKLGRV